jgi:RimJ/RimL family protein N-acetyltransferase
MKLEMVLATENYFSFIRELRNNPITNKGFINRDFISEESHLDYMKKNSVFYKICLLDGVPVGYIGIIENDIRIAVHNDYLQLGIGTFMLNEITKDASYNLSAKIKIENIASIKLFEKLGYKKRYYIYEKN